MEKKRFLFFKKNITLLLLFMCLLLSDVMTVCAGGGWVDATSDEYKEIYGTIANSTSDKEQKTTRISKLEKQMSAFFASLADGMNDLLGMWNIDLTVEGIVYGRIGRSEGNGLKMDVTHFGLERNNPWGVAGATIFYNLRRIMLIFVAVALLIKLGMQLTKNTAKGRAELKELAEYTVIAFVLLFSLPYVLDAFIYVRDGNMYVMNTLMEEAYASYGFAADQHSYSVQVFDEDAVRVQTTREMREADYRYWAEVIHPNSEFTFEGWYSSQYTRDGYSSYEEYLTARVNEQVEILRYEFEQSFDGRTRGGIYGQMYAIYEERPSMLNAFLLFAVAGAGVCFLGFYILTALLMTACFGLFPLIVLYGFWNRRILQQWMDIMIPNMLVQFIDMLLLQVPIIISCVYQAVFGDTSLALVVVLLFCYWAIIPVRMRILKLLGFDGIMGGRNGLVAAALMAARFLPGLRPKSSRGSADRDDRGSIDDYRERAREEQERQGVMDRADRGMKELPPLDDKMTYSGSPSYESETDHFLESLQKQADTDMEMPALDTADADVGLSPMDGIETDVGMPSVDDAEANIGMPEDRLMDSAGNEAEMSTIGDMPNIDASGSAIGADISKEAGTVFTDNMDSVGMKDAVTGNVGIPEDGRSIPVPDIGTAEQFQSFPRLDSISNESTFTVPKGKPDMDFASSLSERDTGRYQNLVRLDAVNDKMQSNEAFIRGSGYDRDTYTADRQKLVDRNDALQGHISRLEEQRKTLDTSSSQYRDITKTIQDANSAKQAGEARIRTLDRAANMERENGFLNQHKERCETMERMYAHNSGLGGMSDKRYASSREFMYQKQAEEVKRMHINYKNFDTKQYDGVLSPQERSDYYRERASRMREEQVRHVAASVAKTAAVVTMAAPGVFAGAAGGSQSSVIAGGISAGVGHLGATAFQKGGELLKGPAAKATYERLKASRMNMQNRDNRESPISSQSSRGVRVENSSQSSVSQRLVKEQYERAERIRAERKDSRESMIAQQQQRADSVREEFLNQKNNEK